MSIKNNISTIVVVLLLCIILLLVRISITNNVKIKIDVSSLNNLKDYNGQLDSIYINISEEDLQKAISILKKSATNNVDEKELLNVLEKQKTSYIQIIVLLTLLIAASGLTSLVQNLISKSDHEKLKDLTDDIKKDQAALKFQVLRTKIELASRNMYDSTVNHFFYSGDKVVNVVDSKTLIQNFKTIFKNYNTELYKIEKFDWLYNDKYQFWILENFIFGSLKYALNKGYRKDGLIDVNKNSIFNFWMAYLSSLMDPNNFVELKKSMNSRADKIVFGDY